MPLRTPLIACSIGAALFAASCAGSTDTETTPGPPTTSAVPAEPLSLVGVVIAVEGDLSGIDSFTLRTEDGSDVGFIPDPDALFDHGPFSHIRDHFTSGSPVRVDYVVLDDGSNLALGAGDA